MFKSIQWICTIRNMNGNKTLYHLVNLKIQNLKMVWSGLWPVAWDMRPNYQNVPQTVNQNKSTPNILKPNNYMPHMSNPQIIWLKEISTYLTLLYKTYPCHKIKYKYYSNLGLYETPLKLPYCCCRSIICKSCSIIGLKIICIFLQSSIRIVWALLYRFYKDLYFMQLYTKWATHFLQVSYV